MCSISGFISKTPLDAADAHRLTRALLWYGSERGTHSAGALVDNKIIKDAVAPSKFIGSKAFISAFEHDVSRVLCHTRQPTSGGRDAMHAQPFRAGSTVTVHNGMLFECERIKKQWEIKKKTDVDSELFTQFIDEYGVLRLPEFVESCSGNSALGIVQSDKMYLFRDGNPISIITLIVPGDNEITAFASTSAILMSALKNVWLIPPHLNPTILGDGTLHLVESSGTTAVSKGRATHSWRGRNWTGEGSEYSGYSGQSPYSRSHPYYQGRRDPPQQWTLFPIKRV